MTAKGESIFKFATNIAMRKVIAEVTEIREQAILGFEQKAEREYQEQSARYLQEVEKCARCQGTAQASCYHYKPKKEIAAVPKITTAGSYEEYGNGASRGTNKLLVCSRPQFEANGTDVKFTLATGFHLWPSEIKTHKQDSNCDAITVRLPICSNEYSFTIEIKPTVGDDYPAVLRQMKQNKSKYLLLRSYNGIGASEQQFKDFFKTQGIVVIFEDDIDAIELPEFDREIA